MPILTQSAVVPSPGGPGVHPVSYTNVSNQTTGFVTNENQITYTPQNIGNLLVLTTIIEQGSGHGVTSVGGTGSTQWGDTGNGNVLNGTTGDMMALWSGLANAIQVSTITVTIAGFPTGHPNSLLLSEYTCPGVSASTMWTVDRFGKANGTSTSVLGASLTLSGTGVPVIYYGCSDIPTGTVSNGTTAGFTYAGSPGFGTVIATDVNTTAVQAPTIATISSSNPWQTLSSEFYATNPSATVNTVAIDMPPVPTGRMWVVSQIGCEFLPANTATNILATVTLNGRTVKPGFNPNAGGLQGPPYIAVNAGDLLEVVFTNAPIGASAVVNFFYTEYPAGTSPAAIGSVV